jgi:hypothetical protein
MISVIVKPPWRMVLIPLPFMSVMSLNPIGCPLPPLKNKKGITAIHDRLGSWNGYAFDLQPFGSARQGGQGIDFPLAKFLIGGRSIVLKCISFSPESPSSGLSPPLSEGTLPAVLFLSPAEALFPRRSFRVGKGVSMDSYHAPLSFRDHLRIANDRASIRPMPVLSKVDSNTGRSGCIYLEGGHGAAGVDQDNDSGANEAPGLNIEFIHSGAPGVKTEVIGIRR